MNSLFRHACVGFTLAALGACVSDLTVGYAAIAREDGGDVVSDDQADASDASSVDAGPARDARVRDGRADDAGADGCVDSPCGELDASASDASSPDQPSAPDAQVRNDAATRDGGTRDGSPGEGGAPMCRPADCVAVGLTTVSTCPDGTPSECRRNDEGVCDLLCANEDGAPKKPTKTAPALP